LESVSVKDEGNPHRLRRRRDAIDDDLLLKGGNELALGLVERGESAAMLLALQKVRVLIRYK
jgi:hypothetical protein